MVNNSPLEELAKLDFPFLKTCHYLDSASVCPPPRQTVEAMTAFYYEHPLNYGIGVFQLAQEVGSKVDRARRTIAEFIGASPPEIVFTKNTTEAINTVAQGLNWHAGDAVVLTTLEHQSNLIPWLRAAKRHNLEVLYLTPRADGRLHPEDLIRLMKNHPVRLVAITHVSNVLGTIQDVACLVQVARDRGSLTLVDAAQSAGRVPVDVSAIACDFAAFCGRKSLMGPQGTGFLYAREDRLRELTPLTIGSRAADLDGHGGYREKDPPHRFEAGILNTAGVIGLEESVHYLSRLGMGAVFYRTRDLSQKLLKVLTDLPDVKILSPVEVELQAGIVSWSVADISPPEIAHWLDKEMNVAVATGHHGSWLITRPFSPDGVVRASVHWFTSEEDIQALEEGLRRLLSSRQTSVCITPERRSRSAHLDTDT
ncbi:MAG: aminotransferase class V-fold PLP-dependent enzyme [Candidatus Binatia bacterium]